MLCQHDKMGEASCIMGVSLGKHKLEACATTSANPKIKNLSENSRHTSPKRERRDGFQIGCKCCQSNRTFHGIVTIDQVHRLETERTTR
jgi:hypothetical protein